MKKWNIIAVAALLALAVTTFGGVYAADKLKIGFVYVGPIGDLGYTYQHEVGRQALQKALNDKVETTYLENVPEGADAERAIEQLARDVHPEAFAEKSETGNAKLETRTLEARVGKIGQECEQCAR